MGDCMKERIQSDMIAAMKSGNKELLSVIRMVKAQIQLDEINTKKTLTDEDVISIISKQIKSRKDSIIEFEKGNRTDLIDKTNGEIEILMTYLPEQLTTEEVTDIVTKVIISVGATSTNDIGKIMKELLPLVKGKADMGLVNKVIKDKLS